MPSSGRKGLEIKVEAESALKRFPQKSHSSPQQKNDFDFVFAFARRVFRCCRGCRYSGGYIGGVPPVPIPNTEVKPSRADGTARETARESRTLPDLF